ncbi:MAG: DUF2339 domain-containing protein [Bryobacterales bacterium]|nr:DUF2339 domain-containing protein [Bryobacterales bacterium]
MTDDQTEALVQANARLVRRVTALEQRVAALEAAQREALPAALSAPPVLEPPTLDAEPEIPPALPQSPVEPAAAHDGLETRLGLTWINRIAVITCALAVAFFFKYAADANWIGPSARIAIGLVTGFATLLFADFLFRRDHRTYAQGIAALAIGIFYLSIYAAFGFYELLPASPAFFLMAVVTAAAGALALRFQSPAIAYFGLLGGYATPILLSTGEKHYWFITAYLLLLSIAAVALSRIKSSSPGWIRLEYLAVLGSGFLYAGMLDSHPPDDALLPLRLYAFAYYALFATTAHGIVFFIAHAFVAFSFTDTFRQQPLAYISVITTINAFAIGYTLLRNWRFGVAVTVAAFLLSWGMYAGATPSSTALTIFYTLNYLLVPAYISLRILWRNLPVRAVELVVASFAAVIYYIGIYGLRDGEDRNLVAIDTYLLAGFHGALAFFLFRRQPAETRQDIPVQFYSGVAAVLLTLAIPLQLAGFRASVAWSVEAFALAWLAGRFSSLLLRIASTGVFILALAILYVQESGSAPLLAFGVAAVSLGIASRYFAPASAQAAAYSIAHAVLISGLVLETLQWARRQPPELVTNIETFAVTALLAVYALALIASGVAARHPLTRFLGLACVAAVIAKLYLYDVWTLRLLYRVVAFGSLGALLLAMSFLYSRFKHSLDRWLDRSSSQ